MLQKTDKERMLTMPKNMLGVALCDASGPLKDLNEKMSGKDGYEVLGKLNEFLRGEPVNAEGMIYIPLEWSPDLGPVAKEFLQDQTDLYSKMYRDGWRLPTHDELLRAMRIMRPAGFLIRIYYWTSTLREDGDRKVFEVIYTHDGHGGLGGTSEDDINHNEQAYPHLRLCREVEIPGQAMMKCNGNPEHHGCEKRKCPHRKPHSIHTSRYGIQEERWCWYEPADPTTFEDGKKNPSGGVMVRCEVI